MTACETKPKVYAFWLAYCHFQTFLWPIWSALTLLLVILILAEVSFKFGHIDRTHCQEKMLRADYYYCV